jgi:hypothetical protein
MEKYFFLIALLLSSITVASAQRIDPDKVVAQLNKDGCVQLDERKLKICRFDYVAGGSRVDAIAIYPLLEFLSLVIDFLSRKLKGVVS